MKYFSFYSNSYPSICGKSNGHHMYIHIGRTAAATASLKVSLASGSSSAKWNILTRQIECDTKWTAPDGCSMWLTGTSGEWSMYGYTSGTTDTEYLMNQNYRVSKEIKKELSTTSNADRVQDLYYIPAQLTQYFALIK